MAKRSYTINELDHEILRVCATPKSTREISEELGANMKTVQWKVGRLKNLGLLEGKRNQKKDSDFHSFRYKRVEGAELPAQTQTSKEYKPLGICVMGVWL